MKYKNMGASLQRPHKNERNERMGRTYHYDCDGDVLAGLLNRKGRKIREDFNADRDPANFQGKVNYMGKVTRAGG
jgi:hypothetical protein